MSLEKQAIKILNGMKEVVENEQLIKGAYITEEVVNKDLAKAGAICGGHQACAIGSLWIGADTPRESYFDHAGNEIITEVYGVDQGHIRDEFLDRPENAALKVAYDAINEATLQYVEKHDLEGTMDTEFNAPVEAFFEGGIDLSEIYPHMMKIIKRAKKNLKETVNA